MLMSRFKPESSGAGSDRSTNCSTTTALNRLSYLGNEVSAEKHSHQQPETNGSLNGTCCNDLLIIQADGFYSNEI